MSFQATTLNIITLLLVTLGLCALYLLAKKRVDSNLPLLFYAGLIAYISWSGRSVDSYLLGGGLASALVMRFEFMNGIFTNLVLWLEMLAITFMAVRLAAYVFGLSL